LAPWTKEKALTEMILDERLGLTQCEEYVIYSNPSIQLGNFSSTHVDVDLHVQKGGEFNTLLNGPVFVKVWDAVIEAGRWEAHAWTVKVDIDAVFFPDRLRGLMRDLEPKDTDARQEDGVFLQNCPLGLHGPLEVLSRQAVKTFSKGRDECWKAPQEDVYLKECLFRLKIHPVEAYDILAEKDCWRDHWHQDPDWMKCRSGKACFHPFKTPEAYHACLSNAGKQLQV
jgi:hypothetical protein